MPIWVDADACPGVIKDILYRAAERASLQVTLVANRALQVPRSPWIRMVQVPRGFDVADNHIAAVAQAGDLVITADIPLAAAVIGRGASPSPANLTAGFPGTGPQSNDCKHCRHTA